MLHAGGEPPKGELCVGGNTAHTISDCLEFLPPSSMTIIGRP